MRETISIIYIVFFALGAHANTGDASLWQSTYPSSNSFANFNCNICHININANTVVNGYGNAYKPGRNMASTLQGIENLDSDMDGESNITEIGAGSNPGDPSSTSANVPSQNPGGEETNTSLDSNSGTVTDFDNANMLSQTSCTTVRAIGNNSGGGNRPPPGAAILLLPFFVLIVLKKSTRLVRA